MLWCNLPGPCKPTVCRHFPQALPIRENNLNEGAHLRASHAYPCKTRHDAERDGQLHVPSCVSRHKAWTCIPPSVLLRASSVRLHQAIVKQPRNVSPYSSGEMHCTLSSLSDCRNAKWHSSSSAICRSRTECPTLFPTMAPASVSLLPCYVDNSSSRLSLATDHTKHMHCNPVQVCWSIGQRHLIASFFETRTAERPCLAAPIRRLLSSKPTLPIMLDRQPLSRGRLS